MNKPCFALRAVTVVALFSGAAVFAGDSTTQSVTFQVSAINEISVSGSPGSLTVSTATAGSAPNAVTDATSTYAITTNETNRKITVAVDSALPTGVTLTANLAAPAGATSAGAVTLSTIASDAVTGISTLNTSGRTITYSLSATTAAGTHTSDTRTVSLTVTAGI